MAVVCTTCGVPFERMGGPEPYVPQRAKPSRLADVVREVAAIPPPPPPPEPDVALPVIDPKVWLVPASRAYRWLARFIGNALCWVPVYFGLAYGETGLGIVFYLGFTAIEFALLAFRGQDVGKLILGIRIYRDSGEPAGLLHAALLRDGVTWVIGLIPGIGPLYRIVDICFIFADDRRCLHDRIAGTVVVYDPDRVN
jgi:uncharacterized RDD family membrane protein YckC